MSSTGFTKHDRPSGVRDPRTKEPQSPEGWKVCTWHSYGIPFWAMGKLWRVKNCPTCQAKVDAKAVPEDAPTPKDLMKSRGRKHYDCAAKLSAQAAARRKYFAAQPAPGRT